MQSEQLLDYVVVRLDKLTKPSAKTFLTQAKNVAYELRGQADTELLLPLFLRLRTVATEITYRPSGSPTAYLLTTQVDETITLRPSDVKCVAEFSEADLDGFAQQQQSDTTTDVTINLIEWWEDSKRDQPDEPALNFLRQLYALAQNKQTVHLTGEVPVTLLLLTVNWFIQLPITQLFYNDNRLQ
ncbi:MAG: hypothetical protein Q8P90_04340 [bacterium]|nr:hypothetical protein [bacterium]